MLLQKLNKSKGFTLIELMIVIAIIAILAAFVIPFAVNVMGTVDTDSEQVEVISQEQEKALEEKVEPKQEKVKITSSEGDNKKL